MWENEDFLIFQNIKSSTRCSCREIIHMNFRLFSAPETIKTLRKMLVKNEFEISSRAVTACRRRKMKKKESKSLSRDFSLHLRVYLSVVCLFYMFFVDSFLHIIFVSFFSCVWHRLNWGEQHMVHLFFL